MPALVLGALPYVIGTSLGNLPIAFFGTVFLLAAAGDLLVRGSSAGSTPESWSKAILVKSDVSSSTWSKSDLPCA